MAACYPSPVGERGVEGRGVEGGGGGDGRKWKEGSSERRSTARNKDQPLSLFPIFLIPVLVCWLPPVHDTCTQDNKQTNKQTNKQKLKLNALDDPCRPHLLSYTSTTSSTVLPQNVSSRLLQFLLDGWVNEGPNLTKINTQ